MKTAELYSDGASSGNPGIAGAGFVIFSDGKNIFEGKAFLGIKTNNEAEYIAAIRGVTSVKKMGFKNIILYSDSKLMVNQIAGIFKVRNKRLKTLHRELLQLLRKFTRWKAVYIHREENKIADRLAKLAARSEKYKPKKSD